MVSPCSLCSAQCCKNYLITVTIFDIARIVKNTGRKAGEFAWFSPVRIVNSDNDTTLEFYDKGFAMDYILALKSHPCVFLGKDDRCTIHEFAPAGCKMYPHKNDGSALIARALCPSVSKLMFRLKKPSLKVQTYLKYINAYKEIVRKWNVSKGKQSECMDFMLKECENYRLEVF